MQASSHVLSCRCALRDADSVSVVVSARVWTSAVGDCDAVGLGGTRTSFTALGRLRVTERNELSGWIDHW